MEIVEEKGEPAFENYKKQSEKSPAEKKQDDKNFECGKCQRNFRNERGLLNHHRSHRLIYKCKYSDCNRKFNWPTGLNNHQLIHEKDRPYECKVTDCSQKFNTKSNLNRHSRIHKNQNKFNCNQCPKLFNTSTNLKQHQAIHKNDERKKYACDINGCNKEYLYKCNLKKHSLEHTDFEGQFLRQLPSEHKFTFKIGQISVKISYQEKKNHSESLITYQPCSNSIQYKASDFRSKKCQDSENLFHECTKETIFEALKNLVEKCTNSISICFQLEPSLTEIQPEILTNLLELVTETKIKNCTFSVPDYQSFSKLIAFSVVKWAPSRDE